MNIITLLNISSTLGQYAQTKVSSRLAYKIMKFCKSVATDEEFYSEKKREIVDMYAIKDENGQIVVDENGIVKIIPDKISEANVAMQELNAIEVDVPSIRFKLEELDELKMSAADMFVLDELIEE